MVLGKIGDKLANEVFNDLANVMVKFDIIVNNSLSDEDKTKLLKLQKMIDTVLVGVQSIFTNLFKLSDFMEKVILGMKQEFFMNEIVDNCDNDLLKTLFLFEIDHSDQEKDSNQDLLNDNDDIGDSEDWEDQSDRISDEKNFDEKNKAEFAEVAVELKCENSDKNSGENRDFEEEFECENECASEEYKQGDLPVSEDKFRDYKI